ncbi:3-alpha,7-alpha,12-alpha-trihydroxy-5-beta-cholest-24-enoyl-CoA hydratase [Aestuariicella hydrocarbonica]|uniref:3-alpha,7-alpha, 12-alpha-trihydroxy-5-beta-cholest-24-enoyl-CoA hydratase n=1 Tax=Pseudomaricurvus hydrocarbonicus TaxID=1470433 RepID=A0A9E5JU72_9GAMM|nr:MaoC/PaaZ C-terminal domain-containing protein [Aestuariicella hydrocarbonica]NHO66629.1 3-alpha,7-alpha,12-alpha-trihydroxy-5-beta-cholest-24-enoyl-CoA hydratase [Aestuariicella hydrocarbonica]
MTYSDNTQAESEFRLDYEAVKSWPFQPLTETYTREDVIQYAHGIGVGMPGPLAAEEEHFLTKTDDLKVLPMMAVVLNQGNMWTKDPKTGIDWTKTVHVEESITMNGLLPQEGELVANYCVEEIYDKGAGKGALMYERKILNLLGGAKDGKQIACVKIATYLRNNGGFGGSATGSPRPASIPDDRPADAVIELSTPTSANTTYHLGEEFLEAVKSELMTESKPMLRGVCSFGIAGRAVLKLTCDNEPGRLRHLGLRYISPVFADETLRTEVWFTEPGKAVFRVSCVERNTLVMNNGVVEFEQ